MHKDKSPVAKTRAKISVKPRIRAAKKKQLKSMQSSLTQISEQQQITRHAAEEIPRIEGYEVRAEHVPAIIALNELAKPAAQLTAQELLDKPLEELEKDVGKREAQNLLKNMRILTAIMLGKNKNKELARMLNTDKSFTSKQIRALEEQGLVKREGEGKETKYEVDRFNVMKFLESKVVIKWSAKNKTEEKAERDEAKDTKGFAREPQKDNTQNAGDKKDGT